MYVMHVIVHNNVQLLKNSVCHSIEHALETFSRVVTALKGRSATDRKLGKALKQV